MNFTQIAGHLGADPEVRFTSTGKKVTVLRVAARTRKSQQGEDTIWWRVTVWGEQYDKMMPYLKKGSPIVVCGELHKPDIFTDREGKSQISMEITASYIQFSPFGKPGGSNATAEGGQQHPTAAPASFSEGPTAPNPYMPHNGATASAKGSHAMDDEVPF